MKDLDITSQLIKKKREKSGLTQKQSADLVYVDLRTWQKWEYGERKINKAAFELFCIKTKQKPFLKKA